MKVVSKSTYLHTKRLRYFLIWLVSLVLSFLLYRLGSHLPTGKLYIYLAALAVFVVGVAFFERGVNYLLGERGENKVAQSLGMVLDDRYTLIRNLVLPDEKADIDGVLVGPFGVLVMEIKNYSPEYSYKCEGSDWFWREPGKRYRRKEESPTKQAMINTSHLKTYLSHHGVCDVLIETVVVITNPKAKFYVKKPHRPIFHPKELGEHIQSLTEEPLDNTACDSIVNLLKHA